MGKIANKYKARSRRMAPELIAQRLAVRRLLRQGLQEATQKQLYDRTPLHVSKKMLRSIFTKSEPSSIAVGYKGAVAPHASTRLAKTGRSKLGGHNMKMQPAIFIRIVYGGQIARVARGTLQRILGD